MRRPKQARFSLREPLRKRLIELDWTISDLAREINRPRPTVSKAIHHGRFPRVLERIKEVLNVA